MFARLSYLLLLALLFIVVACGGSNAAFAGDDFSQKSRILQEELARYGGSLPPNERHAVAVRINAALLAVLQESESLTAEPRTLLGGDKNFSLRFGDWVNVGAKRYRLVVLEPTEVDMGGMTTLFCQARAGGEVSMAAKVYSLTQGATVGRLAYSAIISQGNEYFLLVVVKNFGPEDKYVSLSVQRLEDGRWQPYRPPNVAAAGRWAINNVNGTLILRHAAMGWDSENDYEIQANQGKVQIGVVGRSGRRLESIGLFWVDGGWVLQ